MVCFPEKVAIVDMELEGVPLSNIGPLENTPGIFADHLWSEDSNTFVPPSRILEVMDLPYEFGPMIPVCWHPTEGYHILRTQFKQITFRKHLFLWWEPDGSLYKIEDLWQHPYTVAGLFQRLGASVDHPEMLSRVDTGMFINFDGEFAEWPSGARVGSL